MSITDPAGRAPRASRFATAQTAIKKQEKDVKRARRRATALWRQDAKRMTPASIIAAGAKPLRILQEILGHADVIALDTAGQGPRNVHMLVTLPARLLDQETALAAIDEDDEDTDGGEDNQDKEEGEDDEYSLGIPDTIVDQSREFPTTIGVGGYWQHAERDLELDPAEREPSLGSLDAHMNQEHWADGDRLDRERGPGVGDNDDDEENGDREPGEDDEPDHDNEDDVRDWPMHGSPQADWSYCGATAEHERRLSELAAAKQLASAGLPAPISVIAGEPPIIFVPTGNLGPGGRPEMRNQATGETGVWQWVSEVGKVVRS